MIKRIVAGPRLPPHQSNSVYAWLIMLIFFVLKYIGGHSGAIEITLAALTLLAFVLLYFNCFWLTGWASVAAALLMCAFGMIWAPHNPGSSVFIVFSAASCATLQPVKRAYQCMGLILLLVVIEVLTLQLTPDFWIPALVISFAIGLTTIMQTALRRSQQNLIRSQEEVAHLATIAERERISRDLHDLLGHTLSLITIKAELAGKLLGRDQQACGQEIADIEKTAREALSEVRSAVTGYRKVGFTHELASAAACLSAANILLVTHIDQITLPPACENMLTLSLREAVTNVVRHSRATQCDISLNSKDNWIVMNINDNGSTQTSTTQPGNGLTGMKERIAALGGQLILNISQGWSLQIRLPAIQRETSA
jgi:two-component system sensor histidine kinase DesK